MAYDKVIDSAQLEAAITASANAIREKTGDTALIQWLAEKGFAEAIAAIEAGGGEIKSLTVADTTSNIIIETLDSIPAGFVWFDPNWGGSQEDSEIDLYKPLFGMSRKYVSGSSNVLLPIAVYKSSGTQASQYAAASTSTMIANYNATGTTAFASDVIRVMKRNGQYVLVAYTLGNYGLRFGQTISYIILP